MQSAHIGLAAAILVCLVSGEAISGDQPAATAAATVEGVAALSPALTPPVRRPEAADSVTGAEPDPEAFDRAGLELWWRHYRQHLALRSDAIDR